jgi:hypothetical protein
MIAFKIAPFWFDTQLHTMLPMFKAMLQVMFCKAIKDLHCFCFYTFYWHKMGSFEHGLGLWEEVEVAGSEVWPSSMGAQHSDVFIR